jgi:hypothetical protein
MSDGIAVRYDGRAYTAAEERLLAAVLAQPSTALLARPGVRPGLGGDVTIGGTPEKATITPFSGIITDTGGGGSYLFVVPEAVSVDLVTRPGGGTSRIDELVVKLDATGKGVDVDVITGTAGASPSAPTIPSGQLRLRELAVPSSGSVALSKPPQRIAALGGSLPVASAAERDAIETIYDGLVVYREDSDCLEVRYNGAWGRVVHNEGWKTLTLTGTTGWTIDAARYLVTWPRVEVDIKATRTGSTLTGDSAGNIVDTAIATSIGMGGTLLPVEDIDLRGSRFGTWSILFRLTSGGALSLATTAPGGALAAGAQVRVRDSYVLG